MNKRTKEVTSILLAVSMIFSTGIKQKEVVALPPEKIKIEYSLGLFYKKKWFTGSISLKDHITCEF